MSRLSARRAAAPGPIPASVQMLTEPWGQTELIPSDPPVHRYDDAVYVPWRERLPWGLFTPDRLIVPGAVEHDARADLGAHRGVSYRVAQPLAIEATIAEQAVGRLDGVHIYGGRFHLHFGHFLVETLSRYWWLAYDQPRGRKILIHGPDHLDGYFGLPWLQAIVAAMGLTQDDFRWSNDPVRVARVSVPSPGLAPQSHVHAAFGVLCRRIGERLVAGLNLTPENRPVYLSKGRLTGGVARIENESVVEDVLARQGVEIVHPETLPLAEQVRLFHTRSVILGITGSAFHLSLFAPPRARLVGLTPIPGVNSNFLLIDRLNGVRNVYLHQPGTAVSSPGGPFLSSFRLPDPVGAARAMLAEI